MDVLVDNIKCGGCANSIRKRLTELPGVSSIEIDIEQGCVSVSFVEEADAEKTAEQVLQVLTDLGYPQQGTVSGLKATGAKAKSFVSCAVGRLDSDQD